MGAGRPTKYKSEYCEELIQHMRKGFSYESFAADCGVAIRTLYLWEQEHEEFMHAKKTGDALCLKHWEGILQMGTTGQLKRLVKETVVMTEIIEKDGTIRRVAQTDSKGNIVYNREYAPAVFNGMTCVFYLQNKFRDHYRNVKNIALSGDGEGGPIKLKAVEPTAEEKLREIRDVTAMIEELNNADKLLQRGSDQSGADVSVDGTTEQG